MAVERVDIDNSRDHLQIFLHRQRYDFVLSQMSAAEKVLEIGTGVGVFSKDLIAKGGEYVGVEFDPEACAEARLRTGGQAEILQADARALPFEDGKFTFVVCLEVLEHLGDWQAGVTQIHRCLKREGTAIISVPYRRVGGKSDSNEFHPYEPGEGELVARLRESFSEVQVFYQFFKETWLMTLARQLRLRRMLGFAHHYEALSRGTPEARAKLHLAPRSEGMRVGLTLLARRPR